MDPKDKEYIIEKIDEILNSTSSKLTRRDREKLVVIREKIKNEKKGITTSFLLKILGAFFWHFFTEI